MADVKKRKRPNSSSPAPPRPIYVVVVESHQHVLEHIHTILRKERLLHREWSMLHFDAHPDLACPNGNVPAKACFLPHDSFPPVGSEDGEEKNLYEFLDSTATGIAEWILPLVLAANLRRVQWVKPSPERTSDDDLEQRLPHPPSQLPLGIHEYHVGASLFHGKEGATVESFVDLPKEATVKVDWPHPYYLEDGCTAHYGNDGRTETFLFPRPLRLEISELPICDGEDQEPMSSSNSWKQEDNSQPSAAASSDELWALDICLDYFACQNPFLTDLLAVNPAFTRALLEVVYQSRFYSSSMMETTTASNSHQQNDAILQHYRRDLGLFWNFLTDFLKGQGAGLDFGEDDRRRLQAFYTNPDQAGELLARLATTFVAHPANSSAVISELSSELIAMTEQALPNLVMPHHDGPFEDPRDRGCINPLQVMTAKPKTFTIDTIRSSLIRVQREILRLHDHRTGPGESPPENATPPMATSTARGHTPFIVTVARSTIDGFTPGNIADELQDELLRFLHSLYCGCQTDLLMNWSSMADIAARGGGRCEGCRFRIVLDYGPLEGSVFS